MLLKFYKNKQQPEEQQTKCFICAQDTKNSLTF